MKPHQKLIVWQEAILFIQEIYKLTVLLPQEEKFGLTSQIRRASVSVALNIAEGAARQTKKEFARFPFLFNGLCKRSRYSA